MNHLTTLIADDDPVICQVLERILTEMGHRTECVHTAADTVKAVGAKEYDLVLLDIHFPDCRDLSTLEKIRQIAPHTDVIVVTAENENLSIVAEAVKLGAFDYVPKPVRDDDIKIRATRLAQLRSLSRRSARAIEELARGRQFEDIIANSLIIRALVRQAKDLSQYDAPVLVVGETGTGKELIARSLHYGGPRRARPFVVINCAAIPTELTESELFGHGNEALTGAHATRSGAFEEAQDGTLFLDEIGDMNPLAQASLLHVLEHGRYRSVGGGERETAARVVFATNQDLGQLMASGKFRKDLYYRISRVRLNVPALRERIEDIPVLAEYFVRLLEDKIGKGVKTISAECLAPLQAYDWPGNVRELKNEIEQAYLRSEGDAITPVDLSSEILAAGVLFAGLPQLDQKSSNEIRRLVEALKESGGNLSKAAAMLGIHRNTAWRWMKRYALERPRS
jgi:two-component system response regulator AtoC